MFKFSGQRPATLGVNNGRLAPCPGTPNCVCSYDQDAQHAIAPISYTSSPSEALAALKQVIQSLERTQIITESADYLYVEATSKLMGFVDDVEFYLDPSQPVIQVRSASRLGQSDLGVNRKRVELIREKLKEAGV
ncbi:DUF1499 domain-containing protein [Leptothermofonsia sichuanensis E412]|jgi:uncharacterized protein (DUF1499 family)|uniref:DUF1499 domain-containing protein n=1 Tax=Leptothermofonsia sichuanensis TaxID=2917832 RepID=UPI001CA6E074|nr:DUF1499 domain-containing protein [Leptothermofonsia sichuanensis]QZZ20593.1 DUF1499 domain-containing protein [Leptothermofonsia sichuanensis E412]